MKQNYDADFSRTEGMLYSYFRDMEYIEQLKTLREQRINEIRELKKDIKNNDGMGAIDYGRDNIQASSQGSMTESCAFKNMTDYDQKIYVREEEIQEIDKQIAETEDKIRNIRDIVSLYKGENNVKKQLIELKYKPYKDGICHSLVEVGEILGYSYRHIRRKRDSIIYDVMRFTFLERKGRHENHVL